MALETERRTEERGARPKRTFSSLVDRMFPHLETLETRLSTLQEDRRVLLLDRQTAREQHARDGEKQLAAGAVVVSEDLLALRDLDEQTYAGRLKKIDAKIQALRSRIIAVRRHKTRFVIV